MADAAGLSRRRFSSATVLRAALALNDAGHLTQATISGDWSTTEDGGHQISLSYIDPDTEAKISLNYDLIVDCRGATAGGL
ncbi:hypothetical protein ACOJBO_01745 [Rhizobium beringeri]